MARSTHTPAHPGATRRPAEDDRAAAVRGSEVQRGTATAEGTSRVRTDHSRMYPGVPTAADGSHVQYAIGANCTNPTSDEKVRTEQAAPSVRASRLPLGPTGWARVATADHFDASITARWESGEAWASNRALARPCGIDEKIVRQWRDARKALPVDSLLLLPPPLVVDVVSWVLDARALTPHHRGLPMLDDALTRIEKDVAPDDRGEVMAGLVSAQRRLTERIARLATEGR